MQLTLVGTQPQRGSEQPIVVTTIGDELDVALDAAYDLLVANAAGDGGRALRPQEQFQVWEDTDPAGTRLGMLTIQPQPDTAERSVCFEYRVADAGDG